MGAAHQVRVGCRLVQKNGPPKTVIRGGAGIFYDRVSYAPYENAFLNNGVRQLDYTQEITRQVLPQQFRASPR